MGDVGVHVKRLERLQIKYTLLLKFKKHLSVEEFERKKRKNKEWKGKKWEVLPMNPCAYINTFETLINDWLLCGNWVLNILYT